MIEVETDHGVVEFPDDFSTDQIEGALKDFNPTQAPTQQNVPQIKLDPYQQLQMQGQGLGLSATTGPVNNPEEVLAWSKAVGLPAQAIGKVTETVAGVASDLASDFLNRTGIDPSAQVGQPIVPKEAIEPYVTRIPGTDIRPLEWISPQLEEGVRSGLAELGSQFTEPGQALMLPFAALKPVQGLFGAQSLIQIPEDIRQMAESENLTDFSRAGTRGLVNLGIAGSIGSHLLKPKVTGATYTSPEGETTVAGNHVDAAAEQGMDASGPRESRETPQFGFEVTVPNGESQVVTRPQAEQIAKESDQLIKSPQTGQLHSDEVASPVEPNKPLGDTKAETTPPIDRAKEKEVIAQKAIEEDPDKVTADRKRYDEVQAEFLASAKQGKWPSKELMQENEDIKNRYGGHVPPTYEQIKAFSKSELPNVEVPKEEPAYAGIPMPKFVADATTEAVKTLAKVRRTISSIGKTKDVRDTMTYTKDVAENSANLYAQRLTNDVRGELKRSGDTSPLDEDALSFVREADNDPSQLTVMAAKIRASGVANPKWAERALKAINHAVDNWDRLNPIANQYRDILDSQVKSEHAQGINSVPRRGYVMHVQDIPDEMGFLEGGSGDPTGFRHIRTHPTFADSIAAGVDPVTLNAVDLLQARLSRGQRMINNRQWVESLNSTTDKQTGLPIVDKPIVQQRGPGLPPDFRAPDGYQMTMAGGQPIAILKGYSGLFDALTKPSFFRSNAGWQFLQKFAALGKSVSLMMDTFHLGRIAAWESIIKPLSLTDPKLPFPSYKKGVLTLDYSPQEIVNMGQTGEIPQSQVPHVLKAQQDVNGLVRAGYNVGGVSDALYQDWVKNIPGIGTFNKWLFNQFQRGAMAEIGELEVGRYERMHPSWSKQRVYREVAKDLNTRFGNLGRQGWLKSKTAQDMARLIIMAPQWNEGLVRSELGAITGSIKGLRDTVKEGNLAFGVLPRAIGAMALGQFAANQLLNYYTRGKPTWENEEEGIGPKLSAWIPDVVGGGPGFFLHPLGLAAEITHLLTSKYEKTSDFRNAFLQFMGGRQSTIMRPVTTYIMGKQAGTGRSIKPEDIYWETLKAGLPAPIGASALTAAVKQLASGENSEEFPGQVQKQVMSSFGVKTDQAPSAEQRIGKLARDFNTERGVRRAAEFYPGDYEKLTQALRMGNLTEAEDQLKDLIKKKPVNTIVKYYQSWPTHPFTQSARAEAQFMATLTPEQRLAYEKARQERAKVARRFFSIANTIQ